MHTLRCAACHGHPALQNFYDLLRDGVSSTTNSSLTDTPWIQASLPIRNGGLSIRRGTSLALSAFPARLQVPQTSKMRSSSHADTPLLRLPGWSGLQLMVFPALKKVMIKSNELGIVLPLWGILIWSRNRLPPLSTRLDFWQCRVLISSDWLHALPISSCGLRLNDAVRGAVVLRLGLKLCQPHSCP